MSSVNNKKSLRSKIIWLTVCTTLIPLLLCSFILFVLVFNLFTSYFRDDMKFFLIETSSNFQNKTVLIEDTLLRIRDNQIIVDYLINQKNKPYVKHNSSDITKQLQQSVNLYSDKNIAAQDAHFLDKVYLYDSQGESFSNFYNPPLQNLQLEFDRKYNKIYKNFIQGSDDVKFIVDEHYINLVFTLYSDAMQNIGTLIFVIDKQSVEIIMQNVKQYEDAFWLMYDDKGQTIAHYNANFLFDDKKNEILQTYYKKPYELLVNNANYLIYHERMNMDFNMIIGMPNDHLFALLYNTIKPYVIIILVVTIIVILVTMIIIHRLTKPLKEIAYSIRLVGKGKLNIKMPSFNSRELAYIGDVFNSMTDRINYLVKEVYEKQLIIKESELKFLQTQINPHFMFNVLNTIALQAKMESSNEVSRMISSFAGLIQASIYHTEKEKITLKQELVYVDYYLYLQNFRFGEKLRYTIECLDEALLELYVPKLSIQFLVENAVMHGIEPKHGTGIVIIKIFSIENVLHINVKDDGIGFEHHEGYVKLPIKSTNEKTGHNQVGLNNTHKMIQHFYGQSYGLTINTKKDNGTEVIIRIPFDYGLINEVNNLV